MIVTAVLNIIYLVVLIRITVGATVTADRILQAEARKKVRKWVMDTGEDPSSYPIDPMFTNRDIIRLVWEAYLPVIVIAVIILVLQIVTS